MRYQFSIDLCPALINEAQLCAKSNCTGQARKVFKYFKDYKTKSELSDKADNFARLTMKSHANSTWEEIQFILSYLTHTVKTACEKSFIKLQTSISMFDEVDERKAHVLKMILNVSSKIN